MSFLRVEKSKENGKWGTRVVGKEVDFGFFFTGADFLK